MRQLLSKNFNTMEIGDHIDKYIVTEVMHGGMSEVYRVMIDGAPIRFVLKRLKEGATEEQLKLFRREMRILQRLKHIHIIEVLEEHYDDDCPYYVMPSCNKSLVDIVTIDDNYKKVILALQMCEGIKFMHDNDVRHRDIKPQNILIKDDIIKVADFGLSRFADRDTTTLTSTSLAAGTSGYMPPEYSKGKFKDGTIEGDVYMVGKTLYYLFSKGGDVSNIRLSRIPLPIATIVEKATQENPEDRYSSLTPIIDALNEFKSSLEAIDQQPKSIKEIKATHHNGASDYFEEIYKHIIFLPEESMKWGNTLRQLNDEDIGGMLKYKRDFINTIAYHFMECIENTTDYIQFDDVDQFVRFTKHIISINKDIATNQQLLSFFIDLAVTYNRWPSMNILSSVLNEVVNTDPEHYMLFIYNHKSQLREMQPNLGINNKFNGEISRIIAK